MTGEMSKADLDLPEYENHRVLARFLKGSLHPFDTYSGPYVSAKVGAHSVKVWMAESTLYDEVSEVTVDFTPGVNFVQWSAEELKDEVKKYWKRKDYAFIAEYLKIEEAEVKKGLQKQLKGELKHYKVGEFFYSCVSGDTRDFLPTNIEWVSVWCKGNRKVWKGQKREGGL